MKRNLRLLAFGGRDFADKAFVFAVLDYLHRTRHVEELIEGGNRQYRNGVLIEESADYLASLWANARGVELITVPAEWQRYGKRAGPLRNEKMAQMNPDAAVDFPGGRGSDDMARTAARFGIPVWRPTPETFTGDRG